MLYNQGAKGGGGGGGCGGLFAMACTDQNIKMISSNYNIITQYLFGETMSTNN